MAGAGAAGDMQLLRLTEENTALKEALLEAQQGGAAAESPVPGVVAFALDDAGVLTAWGPEAERLFARSAKDIVGRELSAAMALTNAAEVTSAMQAAQHGGSAAVEVCSTRPDGTRAVALGTLTKRAGEGRAGVAFAGVDITARFEREQATKLELKTCEERVKRMEEALRAEGGTGTLRGEAEGGTGNVADLDTFIRSANAPIFATDLEGKIKNWNDKTAQITGIPWDEVVGKSLVDEVLTAEFREETDGLLNHWPSLTAELRAGVQTLLSDALSGADAADIEIIMFSKSGERVDFIINASPRRALTGEIVGVIMLGQNMTDRNRTALEKSRVAHEMRVFIETANAPIFGIDAGGLVNEWNLKAAEITGYSSEEVMGQSLVDVYIHADFRDSVRSVFDNALQGLGTANFEFPIYTKDQRRVEVLLNATPRFNVNGQVTGVVGVGQDITQRKEVEIEKGRVAQELQTFIDTANAPIFGIDENGFVNEWNNKAVQITGFTREEVFGQDLVQVYITEEYRDQVAMVLTNALQGEETANFEFPLFTKNEQRVEVLLNATTRRDVTGRPIGVIGVGQDITSRKQIEQEKSRIAQELQTFINTANAPIFGCDALGLVNEWNNKAHEITGYPKEEVLGKNLVQVYITKEFRASVKQVLDDAFKGLETANFEFALFTKDNKRVEVLLNATTRRDVPGAIIGMIGVGQDITEKRRLMEQEALLFQAQAANDAKSQFLATMSHEMRTPLNVIMGMNDLITETLLSAEQRTFAEQVKTSAESLLILINDILDLTKVEAGKLELVAVDFDVRQVMEDAIDSAASRSLAKGLEICSYMNPETRTMVNGDPDRLRQILLNLLSNAIKFTKEGQVYMLIEEEEETKGHHAFRFKVYDSGIGITWEGQKKLFSRFSQVDSSTTRTYGGTGLGLAISKQFAELMDGSMGVQSEVGRGSLFWFTAVFKKMAVIDPMKPLVIPKVKNNQALTALLKAENETLRNMLLRYLDALGLIAVAVETLDQAMEMLEADPGRFDLFFLCPAITPHEGEEKSEDTSFQSRMDLHHSMAVLQSKMPLFSKLETIVLCPINHLSHASTYREMPGCTILSRPVRLGAVHDTIISCAIRIRNEISGNSYLAANMLQAAPEKSVKNMRVLISVQDMCQRIVLRAMLAREQHVCVLVSSGSDTLKKLAVEDGGWNHDFLVLDTKLLNDITPAEVVRTIREKEADPAFTQKPLRIVGAVDDEAEEEACLAMGMQAVCMKPFDRVGVEKALQSDDPGYAITAEEEESQTDLESGSGGEAKTRSLRHTAALDSSSPQKRGSGGAPRMVEGKIKVLVVDDDRGQRMVLQAMLSKMGYFDIVTAEDGEKALGIIREGLSDGVCHFNVVLTDGHMPKMNGWELTEAIRKDEERLGSPDPLVIIGVTGATEAADQQRCKDAGMTDVVHKPMTRDALVAKISQWVVSVQAQNKMELLGASSPLFSNPLGSTAGGRALLGPNPVSGGALPRPAPTVVMRLLEGPLRIIVVDDAAGSRISLKALLAKDKHTVDAAKNSEEALKKMETATFDVAIINFALPGKGLSGCETVKAIRAKEAAARPGAVAMHILGATTAPEQHAECLAAGMNDTIPKPPNRDALSQKLAAISVPSLGGFTPPPSPLRALVPRGPPVKPAPVAPTPTPQGLVPKVPARILIVEDHWANRKLIEAMLLQKGHTLDLVEHGGEAVAITNTTQYDLILMDCNMPIMDGWQATEKIRQRKGLNERVPIIAVTANAMKGDRDKCIEAGMDDYISKPVDRKKLYEIIAKWTMVSYTPPPEGGAPENLGPAKGAPPLPAAAGVARPTFSPATGAPAPSGFAPAGAVAKAPPKLERQNSVRTSHLARNKAAEQSRPKILLVDDDDTLRLLVKSRLDKDNYVVPAGDGEEALACFNKGKFDIVISDVFMPKMDGFELCREIRKVDRNIPIVMLTSMNDVKDRIKGLDAGADDYIVKPFAPKELEARVRSLLRRRREESEKDSNVVAAGRPSGGDQRRGASGGIKGTASSVMPDGEVQPLANKVWELDKLIGLFQAHLDNAGIPLPEIAAGQ